MESWVPVALVAMLLVGGGGGYFVSSGMYTPQITSLQGQLTASQQETTSLNTNNQGLSQEKAMLQTSLAQLQSDYASLQSTHTNLQADYATLSSQYDTLSAGVDTGFASLSADYIQLQKDYNDLSTLVSNNVYGTPGDTQMLNHLKTLTLAVRSLNSTLWNYCNEVSSFRRTLTTGEVLKMETPVRSRNWFNQQTLGPSIRRYTITSPRTSSTSMMLSIPYISFYTYLDVNGVRYLTDFEVETIANYVQTPEWTLTQKQGDCDDQAALEYAMLRYYNKYIAGTDYNLYLTELDFSDGSSHVAVFMPVTGGKLTILDPAGNYLTKTGSTIASKAAASELDAYNYPLVEERPDHEDQALLHRHDGWKLHEGLRGNAGAGSLILGYRLKKCNLKS